jgi:hypothetical protein
MREAMHNGESVAVVHEEKLKRRMGHSCSICTSHIWLHPVQVMEPEGVPEPRLSWVLCKPCYQALQQEMQRSPVRSPLRLRIAMGLVAAERWPHAYSTRISEYVSDRRWIIFIAACFLLAMIFHLALIVVVATLR